MEIMEIMKVTFAVGRGWVEGRRVRNNETESMEKEFIAYLKALLRSPKKANATAYLRADTGLKGNP